MDRWMAATALPPVLPLSVITTKSYKLMFLKLHYAYYNSTSCYTTISSCMVCGAGATKNTIHNGKNLELECNIM